MCKVSCVYMLVLWGQLAESCDVGVAKQAAATLLNMVASEKEEMGQRGAVESLLGTSRLHHYYVVL